MTPDYHWKHPKGITKEEREKLNIGDIYINWAVCLLCKTFIRSKNKHHYVTCKCGNVSVDWWSHYQRLIGNTEDYISIIENYE